MALYTKIKGPVNYTAIGTLPTISNGIASDFTTTSGLMTDTDLIDTENWEMQIKFYNTETSNNYITLIGTRGFGILFVIASSRKAGVYLSSTGNSWDYASNTQGSYSIPTNQWVYYKLIKTSLLFQAYYSLDRLSWTKDIEISMPAKLKYSSATYAKRVAVGYLNENNPHPFPGQIDLNETYVKVNNTAWFGSSLSKVKVRTGLTKYVKVGNLIDNNGVISGFTSSSTYVYFNSPFNTNSNFEILLKLNTGNMTDNFRAIIRNGYGDNPGSSGFAIGIAVNGSNKYLRSYLIYEDGTSLANGTWGQTAFQNNIDFLFKFSCINNILKIETSLDNGITWVIENSWNMTQNLRYSGQGLALGGGLLSISTQWWSGSIDIGKSYIKVDNGYYWRGAYQNINAWKIQQDNFSKYYTIVNGKLTWANPDIYLQSTGTQYIDTGLKGYLDFKVSTQGILDNKVSQVIISRQSPQGNWFGQYSNTKMWSIGEDTSSISYLQKGTFHISFQDKKITYTYNNTTYEKTSTNDYSNNNIYLFACNSNNKYYATAKLWKCIAYQNNIKIQHLVPVPKGLLIGNFVVPSNGMFDIVEQKFYGNAGTGDFAIGGIPQDYIIEGGRMLWCNPNIYLESTGTQYINSNFVPTNYSKWVLDAQFTDTSINSWNGRYNTSSSPQRFDIALSSNTYVINGGNTTNFNGILTADTNRHIFILDMVNEKGIIDNTYEINLSTVTMTSTKTVKIFARQGGSSIESYCREKIYSSQFYEKQTIEQYLVPVPKGMLIGDKIAPSNCMFDLVTQTFFTNQRTGDFIIGGISGDYINIGDNIVWVDNNVYLQSSGGKYIDTNIKPTNLTVIEGKVMLMEINKCIYGSRTSKSDSDIHDWIVNTATTNFPQFGSDDSSITYSWNLNQTYIIKNGQNGAYINGSSVRSYNTYTFSSTWNMYLFGLNQAGSLESRSLIGRVYNFQIIENTKLIRYLLPVNTNTVIGSFTVPSPGMWDAVTRKFYPNKGSGSFTYGKDS